MTRALFGRVLSVGALFACLTTAVFAEDVRNGPARFTVPAGWTAHAATADGVSFLTPATPGEGQDTRISLLPVKDSSDGDLKQILAVAWGGITKGVTVMQHAPIVAAPMPQGYEAVNTTAVVRLHDENYFLMIYLVRSQGRVEQVTLLTNRTAPAQLSPQAAAVAAVLAQLRFDDAGAAPAAKPALVAAAAPPRDRLDGVYRGYGRTSVTRLRFGNKYLTFFANGRVLEGLPEGGMDQFDQDAAIKLGPAEFWGRYEWNGSHGTVTFASGAAFPIVATVDGIKFQDDVYVQLRRCDNLRLSGRYRRPDATSDGARKAITFAADGTFSDEGVFAAANVITRTAKGSMRDDGVGGTGTYRFNDYTLELNFRDGRKKRVLVDATPSHSCAEVPSFNMNDYPFTKQP